MFVKCLAHSHVWWKTEFLPVCTSQPVDKRLRISPQRCLSCHDFLARQGVQVNGGSQREQRGGTLHGVGGSLGSHSLQTSQWPGEVIQTEDSPGHWADPSSS